MTVIGSGTCRPVVSAVVIMSPFPCLSATCLYSSDRHAGRQPPHAIPNRFRRTHSPLTAASITSSAEPGPEASTERADVMLKIQQALDEDLTERQRQALVAMALQGVPLEILAERMGTNRNALYKLIHDARRKLRAHLESEGLSTRYMLNLFEDT